MITESLHEYLETVAGYIFDDDKLVNISNTFQIFIS